MIFRRWKRTLISEKVLQLKLFSKSRISLAIHREKLQQICPKVGKIRTGVALSCVTVEEK